MVLAECDPPDRSFDGIPAWVCINHKHKPASQVRTASVPLTLCHGHGTIQQSAADGRKLVRARPHSPSKQNEQRNPRCRIEAGAIRSTAGPNPLAVSKALVLVQTRRVSTYQPSNLIVHISEQAFSL